jgi:hypothetical protein
VGALTAACAVLLIGAGDAAAQSYPEQLAKRVESEVVHVEKGATPKISAAAAGRIRLRILRKDNGRIKIGVVMARHAAEYGGATGLTHAVARHGEFRGALMIVAENSIYVVTSHGRPDVTANAVREAFEQHKDDRPRAILAAVDGIAATDPGPSADLDRPQTPATGGDVPGFDDAEGIFDAIRIGTIVVMGAIALPFILFAIWLALRFRRQAKRGRVMEEDQRQNVANQLIVLGDRIRALDLDAQMPGVTSSMLADYEAAIAQYDRANDLLSRSEDVPHRVAEAGTAVSEGLRRIEMARQRLGHAPVSPEPGRATPGPGSIDA